MSDELVWHRRSKGEDNWRARNGTDDGTYVVDILAGYGTPRTYGVLLSDYTAAGEGEDIYIGMDSIDTVKALLQEHHNAACRAARWREFMRDNEPPEGLSEVSAVLRKQEKQ